MLQQEGNNRRISTSRSNVQRRPAIGISGVDLCALGQQCCHPRDISCLCGLQQLLPGTLRGQTLPLTHGYHRAGSGKHHEPYEHDLEHVCSFPVEVISKHDARLLQLEFHRDEHPDRHWLAITASRIKTPAPHGFHGGLVQVCMAC
jgi:hypothetical protein